MRAAAVLYDTCGDTWDGVVYRRTPTTAPACAEADMLGHMRNLGYSEVLSAVTPRDAVDALREVLKGGFDPAYLDGRDGWWDR